MAFFTFRPSFPLLLAFLVVLIFYARPAHAFGAGNIASLSKIEGQNWRHGDIEDTLLTLFMTRAHGGKKFSKMDVKRVYFGNWLRDYSQAVDVGTVKMVSAEAIRLLLWILGFLSFGYGTGEFEVTTERLGCYRPEEHIDNPKDYADNLDARQYDRRLRGPVDERRELGIDERTGLKNYIASEDLGITTSAGMVRDLLRRCIDLGRRYQRNGNKNDLYEAFRLLGTATHCMEDYSAHSNYTELALIELGERDVFPHVGRRTQVRVQGARHEVYPIVTGTFGGVDFLHSVMGEVTDKVTQSELQELEGSIAASQGKSKNGSMLKDLLNDLPDGLFGGKDEAGKADELEANSAAAQMENMRISPKEPEEFTQQAVELSKQIYPILQFHDEIMLGITETIENIPVLPELIENVTDQLNVFVFSLLAPYVLPVISQIKEELSTGSSEVIQSSRDKQLIVFEDDNCSDPTHSMLSKDHFSNQLNEPAGKIASQVLKWVVPQIVECWDDDRADVERTIQRIVTGVFHHPVLRDYGDDGARDGRQLMFGVVQEWWGQKSEREKDDLRSRLSRDGVQNGRNHKEGVKDSGHGCCKPLGKGAHGSSSGGGNMFAQLASGSGRPGRQNDLVQGASNAAGQALGDAVGGGALGGLVGGLVGAAGAGLLSGAFSGEDTETQSYSKSNYNDDGSYTSTQGQYGRGGRGGDEKYGQAEYSQTQYPGGGRREEFSRYEQEGRSGGYERREEKTTYQSSGGYQREERVESYRRSGEHSRERKKKDSEDEDEDDYAKKERKRREKEEKKQRKKRHEYGDDDDDNDSDDNKKSYSGGRSEYGQRQQDSYGQETSYGSGGRGGGYGGGREQEYGESRRNEYSSGGYGESRREEYSSGGYGEPRREEYSSGGYGESRRDDDRPSRGGYGEERRGGYGRSDEMPGGFGRDDESNEYERRDEGGYGSQGGYGSRGGYGSQGYGGSGY